ncbi:MAG: sensor histidine kinase [Sedimenticola sp.]
MRSLERRLQLGLGLSLALLTLAMLIIGSQSLGTLTENFMVSRLEHDAESILGAMEVSSGKTQLNWHRIDQLYSRPFSGHYFAIRFPDGTQLTSRSLWDQRLDFPLLSTGESRRLHGKGPSDQSVLMLAGGFSKSGVDFTLAVAEDLTPLEQDRDRFIQWFLLLAAVGFFGLLALQGFVVRRTLRPLEGVRDEIRLLQEGRTGKLSEDVPAEILPLIREFNQLLLLMNQRLERSRNGLGNLAHALKGPLNLLTQYIDARLEEGSDKKVAAAGRQVERIRVLMARELKRARFAGSGLSGVRFNPADELPDLVAVLQQVHDKRNLDIRFQIDGDPVPFGDREDMLELLGNLLDNACKWAVSQVDCIVRVEEGVSFHVEDDGKGLGQAQIEQLIQRGSRLDESVEGHGLGLSIVNDIVKLYGAELTFEKSARLGGLAVRVHFPSPV